MSEDLTPAGESVPWILRHAAERRGEPIAPDGVDAPAAEAPVSKFRRVSGAPTTAAAAPVRLPTRPAAVAARAYTPPPAPAAYEWEPEVDTYRPPSRPTPPPPSPSRSHDYSPYAPTPARRKMSGGVLAGIVVGAVLLGGGGVGGVLLATKGGAPSRAEFVADADDVCRPANGPVAAIVKPTSYPELATAAGTLTTTIDAQLGQLRGLDQPGGSVKTEVAAVYTSLEGTSAAAKRLQDAAGRQDDAATIAATKDMATSAGEARTKATTTGFTACSVGMQTGIDAVSGGTNSVIKAGFVAQADVLCRRASNDLDDIEFPASDTGRAFAGYIGATIEVFEHMVTDIRALPVAPGDEATVAEILTAQDKANAKEREFQDAAVDDEFDRMDALDREITTLITAADAKWDAYGLGSCGSNFGF